MPSLDELRAEYLTLVCGYVLREGESMPDVYARLRREEPDLFPIPRDGQTQLEAMAELVRRARGF